MAESKRQALFAKLKGKHGYLEDESFGLFLEEKTGLMSPFIIEYALEAWFDVGSCADIKTEKLENLMKQYEEWQGR